MHKYKLLLWLILFFSSAHFLKAQTFKAGLVFGVNGTQVDGDGIAGYHKVGLNGGFFANLPFNEKFSSTMEIIYSQKGSKNSITQGPANSYLARYNYACVPIYLNYHDKKGKVNFGAGISINRLIGYDEIIFTNSNKNIPSTFKKSEYSMLANGNYLISEHVFLNIRAEYSILPIGYSTNSKFRNNSLRNNIVSIRLGFVF